MLYPPWESWGIINEFNIHYAHSSATDWNPDTFHVESFCFFEHVTAT